LHIGSGRKNVSPPEITRQRTSGSSTASRQAEANAAISSLLSAFRFAARLSVSWRMWECGVVRRISSVNALNVYAPMFEVDGTKGHLH